MNRLSSIRLANTSRELAINSVKVHVIRFKMDLAEINKALQNETCNCCKERIYHQQQNFLAKTEPWVKAIYLKQMTAEEVWDRYLKLEEADKNFWKNLGA